MAQFTPARLALARKRRGFTKKLLAEKAGLSLRSVTGYESGTQEPTEATIQQLAMALEFPVGFFSGADPQELSVGGASFRALTKMTATQRNQALSAGVLAVELSHWIEEQFQLPDVGVPNYVGVDAELAAEGVRSEWSLGERPISNLIHLLESKGVRVFSLAEECREIDAFSFWHQGIPYIFLNTQKSAEHSRLDAAHELGHLVLHGSHEIPHGKEQEREAFQFGSSFLMPKGDVIAHAPRGGRIPDLIKAKKRWGVSVASLAVRLHQVALLSEWQYYSIFVQLGRLGYRTSEPEEMERESSQVLAKVFQALRDDRIGHADVARTLQWPTAELQKLVFGLVLSSLDGAGGGSTKSIRPPLRIVN